MREEDTFAFGPRREKRVSAAAPRHVRSRLAPPGSGGYGIASVPLLLVTALVLFAVTWCSFSLITCFRAIGRLGTWLARVGSGVSRRPRVVARPRAALATTIRRGASGVGAFHGVVSQQGRRVRGARRWIKSRRITASLAVILSFLIFGGVVPVNAATNDITTVAGRPDFGDGGAATSALIHVPSDVATDASGSVYIADTYNHRIRKVTTTGIISTVAGTGTSGFSGDGGAATTAQLRFPQGVWVDASGNLYIADSGNNRVRKVDTSGTISTVAGTGTAGFAGDGGPATAARLNDPKDVTTDASGNLYVADNENHRIRKVGTTGTITTYAGNGVEGYAGDGGAATSARLNDPTGVAINSSNGTLYIGDRDNHRIRQVTSAGTISTYVGNGTAGDLNHAQLSKSKINSPERLVYSSGLYFADTRNHKIKFVNTSNSISTIAGSGSEGFSGDGGAATSAALNDPTGVAVSGTNVYIADSDNHRVRRRNSAGTISTYAGKAHFGGDGGPATNAALNRPYGVTADAAGNLLIADTENHRVRRISGGTITTVAGSGTQGFSGDGGAATSAQLNSPYDIAVDAAGNIYIADTLNHRVRKVSPAGTITTVAGTGVFGFSGDGGQATAAQLYDPIGLDLDAAGNLYIADYGNHRIRKVDTSGVITTVAGNGTGMYCGDGGAATSACLENPTDVDVDAAGNMFIADYNNDRIRKVTAGTIRTVAGNGSGFTSGDGGAATSAGVPTPVGVAVDAAGDIFIASYYGGRIRKVSPAGTITTVAGTGAFGFSGDGGPAVSAQLALPARVALDPSGNFYIADVYNNRIRMVEGLGSLPGPTMSGTTPVSPANDNNPLVYGTAEPGTTVTVYTDGACTGPVAASGTDAAFASPGLAVTVPNDSTTSFHATATDGQGRVSACSMTAATYIEDSTPPGAPTITLAPPSPGSDHSPSWSFSTEGGATTECELSRGGTTLSPYGPCTSPHTYDLSGEPDGSYTFRVRATDVAGNTGPAASDTYVLDSTLPGAPRITVAPPTPSNDRNPTWEFTVDAGSTAECEFSYQGTVLDPFAPCTSPFTRSLAGELDGDYTFRVQARDGAGNPSAPVSSGYTLDTTAPGAPTIDSAPTSPSNVTFPSWVFSIEAGSSAECELRRGGTVVSGWQACASPKSYDLSGESDGDYDFSVRAVDTAGNTGPAASDSYTLDTTGPDTSITASPSSPDSAPDPTWSISTEAGASAECELRLAGNVVSPWTACAGSATYDLSGQPDGAYTFSVHATDAAGNTGDPASSVYVLDTTPPVVSIDSGPAPVSSELHPEWSFSSEPGVTMECELSSTAGVIQPFGPCTSPQQYDLTGQPDDTYTFSVRATDPAGNVGPASSSGYYLDTTGPVSSITSSPATPGNTRSPSWSFTAEPGASTECELSSGATIISPYAACSSPTGYDLTGQPDGPYTFSVHAIDAAGNVGAPASHTYTLDTTAPAAPTITSAPASPGNLPSASWSFTTELGATTECQLSRGGTVVSPFASCVSPKSYSLTGLPDGDYTFRARATDGVGNTGPTAASTYTFDTTGPTVTITPPPSPGNDRTPTWTYSTEPGASTECQLSSGAGVLQPFAPCGSPATYDLSGQPDGSYTVSVRATDVVGNTGPTRSSTYVLDTSGPATTIDSGPTSPGNAVNPTWSFSTEPDATTECELSRAGTVLHPFGPCSGSKTYDLTGQPDGDYTFRVRATDAADNTGPDASETYTFDATGPAVPVITSVPASPGSATSVAWSFSAEPAATTECELSRGGTVLDAFAACASPAAYSLTGEPDGEYTFRVRAVDDLGNASAAASSTYTLDTTGPSVTIIASPATPGTLRNPTWSFTTEAGATTECTLTGGAADISPAGPCVSPVSFDLNGQPDGSYTLQVRATDALGNSGPATTSTYVLDTVEPGGGGTPPPPEAPDGGGNGGGGNGSKSGADPASGDGGVEAPGGSTEPSTGSTELPAGTDSINPFVAPYSIKDGGAHQEKGTGGEEHGGLDEVTPSPDEVVELVAASQDTPRGAFAKFVESVGTVAARLLQQPVFPAALLAVVLGFLVLQNLIDRRDPKLALAPVYADSHLYFEGPEGAKESPGKDR